MKSTTSRLYRKLSVALLAGAFLFTSVTACSFLEDDSDDDNSGILLLGGAAALLGILSSSASTTANQSGMVVDVPKGVAAE